MGLDPRTGLEATEKKFRSRNPKTTQFMQPAVASSPDPDSYREIVSSKQDNQKQGEVTHSSFIQTNSFQPESE